MDPYDSPLRSPKVVPISHSQVKPQAANKGLNGPELQEAPRKAPKKPLNPKP